MKTEKLHEGWRALWLAIAGVMAIMLMPLDSLLQRGDMLLYLL
jgi:hypothetical protein